MMILKLATLKRLVGMVLATEDEEMTCDECFAYVDHFAELTLAGKDADEAYPLVQAHLNRCPDCRAEFEALLDAIRALEDDSIAVADKPSTWQTIVAWLKRVFSPRNV